MKYDITLIFPPSPFLINEAVFPPLGIMYLSAYLKKLGMNVQCLDLGIGHTKEMAEAETIGISFTTPQRKYAYKLAKYYRDRGHFLIAGGPHPTHMPGPVRLNGFNIVIRGYGEQLLASILGIRDARGFINDYFPDRDGLPLERYKYQIDGRRATPIMTIRGCPYNCTFCAKIDQKCYIQTAERVAEELFHIRDKYGISGFMIFDDVFLCNKERNRKLVEIVGGEDFVFRCFGRSDLIDPENCQLMSRMGVSEVGLGIESGSDAILEKTRKGTTCAMNLEAVRMLKKAGIRVKVFLMVGLPGETEATVWGTIDWIERAEPDDIDVTVFQPLPGSEIFEDPKKWGIEFEFGAKEDWYKGRPGEYTTAMSTEGLTSEQIIYWRDEIEKRFKKKELLK